MADNKKFLLPIILSMVALLLSGMTVYFEFVRSIDLELIVSRHIYIANTTGGRPDVSVGFVVRADGPSIQTISLDVEVVLKNMRTDTEVKLIPDPKDGEFPAILEGGDIVFYRTLFSPNLSLSDTIHQHDNWFNQLREELPEYINEIDEIHEQYKRANFVILNHTMSSEQEEITELRDVDSLLEKIIQREPQDINEKIRILLNEASAESLQRLLFFTSGNYEMQINITDPLGDALISRNFRFSVDDVLAKTLRNGFNVNTLVMTDN